MANVELPSGKLMRERSWLVGSYNSKSGVSWQVSSLYCTGDDIESVTFITDTGGFANCDYFRIYPIGISDFVTYIYERRYTIDKTTFDDLELLSHQILLIDHVKSGALDNIIGKNLCEQIVNAEDNRYLIKVVRFDANGTLDGFYGFDENLTLHYELQIIDYLAELYAVETSQQPQSELVWELGQSVTVKAGEVVNYCPAFATLLQVSESLDYFDYSMLSTDTIEVIIVATSGEVMRNTIILNFDKAGTLSGSIQSDFQHSALRKSSDEPIVSMIINTINSLMLYLQQRIEAIEPISDLALPDVVPNKNLDSSQQQYSSVAEAYRLVLFQNAEIIDLKDGKYKTIQDYLHLWEENSTHGVKTSFYNFTVVDLDGDGIPEIILGVRGTLIKDTYYHLVLSYKDGQVLAYELGAGRQFRGLRINGVFNGSGGAGTEYFMRVCYTSDESGKRAEVVTIAQSSYIQETIDGGLIERCELDGMPASLYDYYHFRYEQYSNVPEAVWFRFTNENIESALSMID
ncbi:MAG: hypothetical protein LBU61_05755 [Coriobacteriales bacterium]|nr:hypothetical protein [Coriobacteriales bacterium]